MLGGQRTGGKARGTAHGDLHGPAGQHQAEVKGRHTKAALTFAPLAEGGGAEQGQQQQPGTCPRQGSHPLPPETHGTLKSRGSEGSAGETAPEKDSCGETAPCTWRAGARPQSLVSAGQSMKSKARAAPAPCGLVREAQSPHGLGQGGCRAAAGWSPVPSARESGDRPGRGLAQAGEEESKGTCTPKTEQTPPSDCFLWHKEFPERAHSKQRVRLWERQTRSSGLPGAVERLCGLQSLAALGPIV